MIYMAGHKVDIRRVKDRITRKSMRTLNIFKPYLRVSKKPINFYTAFCQSELTAKELKIKNGKNSLRRLAELGKMV